MNISIRLSNHDEARWYLEEIRGGDFSLNSKILRSQRWASTVQKKKKKRNMLRPTKVASEDCDLPQNVPSQSEA